MTVDDVFNLPPWGSGLEHNTLLVALEYEGDKNKIGAAQILLRHAVAAVLNAEHPYVDYPMTLNEIVTQVNTALATDDRDKMLDLKDRLDSYNNLGGGIDAHGNPL